MGETRKLTRDHDNLSEQESRIVEFQRFSAKLEKWFSLVLPETLLTLHLYLTQVAATPVRFTWKL